MIGRYFVDVFKLPRWQNYPEAYTQSTYMSAQSLSIQYIELGNVRTSHYIMYICPGWQVQLNLWSFQF